MRSAAWALLAISVSGCASNISDHRVFVAGAGPIQEFAVPLSSVQARKFTGVIHQRYDFSCGSAALATLLRYHYGYAVDEEKAFRGMWDRGDRAQIRKLGFSLLDMKRWLAAEGLGADGYKVSLDQISRTGIAGLALVKVHNYRHFVVVKGLRGNEVLVGDPSTGLATMSRPAFEAIWNGIFFVINDRSAFARSRFNSPESWAAYGRAPLGLPFSEPVSQQALALTAPVYGDF
jgi:predicted double-glycine peptidase